MSSSIKRKKPSSTTIIDYFSKKPKNKSDEADKGLLLESTLLEPPSVKQKSVNQVGDDTCEVVLDKSGEICEPVSNKADEIREIVSEKADNIFEVVPGEIVDVVSNKADETCEVVLNKSGEIFDVVSDKVTDLIVPKFDIANFVTKSKGCTIGNEEKVEFYKKLFIPGRSAVFPVSTTRKLRFQYKWLESFTWLSYSSKLDGCFCKVCVIFGCYKEVSRNAPGKLCSVEFNTWKKAIESFRDHEKNEYHKKAIQISKEVIGLVEG